MSTGTALHDILHSYIHVTETRDREWAGYSEIMSLSRNLNVIVAILDTRHPENGFVYHYVDDTGVLNFTNNKNDLPSRAIIRLAYTGNHYLSVRASLLEHSSQILRPDF